MTAGRRLLFSRRTFFKVSAVLSALTLRFGRPLFVASALPLAGAHVNLEADELVPLNFDAALLPAYAAVNFIRQRYAHRLGGPPGRAHDPEGAFTIPSKMMIAAVAYTGAEPVQPLLEHIWTRNALWPRFGRLALGVALLRHGYSPNTLNLNEVEAAAQALRELKPRFVPDVPRALEAGEGTVGLVLRDAARLPISGLPAEARLMIEYDWVVPRTSTQPKTAEDFIRRQPRPFQLNLPRPYTTLAALPELARMRYAELWQEIIREGTRS
ncbi:MAG: hypothetical protein JNL09_01300 [Anaerolineales bacterium]|nr:hypothetical protein [Anaerolineales bacterium]